MFVICDDRSRVRSEKLRERFLDSGYPCALCTPDELSSYRAPVVICFAASDDAAYHVVSRAPYSTVIAINRSQRRLLSPGVIPWNGESDGDILSFALAKAKEKTSLDPQDLISASVRINADGVFFKMMFLRLTPTERRILFHLAAFPDRFHTEREIRKYACRASDLRKKGSAVSVHICSINKKVRRASGDGVVVCRRGEGYAIFTLPPKEKAARRKPGFIPPFS